MSLGTCVRFGFVETVSSAGRLQLLAQELRACQRGLTAVRTAKRVPLQGITGFLDRGLG